MMAFFYYNEFLFESIKETWLKCCFKYVFTQPLCHEQAVTQGQHFKQSKAVFIAVHWHNG